MKVALSGLGGDELFGGYPSFNHIPKLMRIATPFWKAGRIFRIMIFPVIKRFTSPKYAGVFEYGRTIGGAYLLRRGLYMPWGASGKSWVPTWCGRGSRDLDSVVRLNQTVLEELGPFSAVSALETTWFMKNMLLRDADWASMAHSLEIRFLWLTWNLQRVLQRSCNATFGRIKILWPDVPGLMTPPKHFSTVTKPAFPSRYASGCLQAPLPVKEVTVLGPERCTRWYRVVK